VYNIILIVREIVLVLVGDREIYMNKKVSLQSVSPTSLKLFTFCFYIGKNTYQELVRMLYVLLASLDKFHPDFFLVVYHNLGITIDDSRVRMVRGFGRGFRPPATGLVCEVSGKSAVYIDCQSKLTGDLSTIPSLGGGTPLLLEAEGGDGNVWIEGSAVRNRWHKLSFNKIHVFKNLYDEYGGECFTWIDLDTIVLADLSYLNDGVDNYFIMHGGAVSDRMHDVLVGGEGGRVIWSIPERMYIQGSFWKLNLPLYHEVLRLDSLFRENGVRLKYDLQSIFAVMAWGGGLCPYYDGVSRAMTNSMLVIGENFRPGVMNGLGVWDTTDGVGNHVNMSSLALMRWEGSAPPRRDAVDIDRRLKLTADGGEGSAPPRRVHGTSCGGGGGAGGEGGGGGGGGGGGADDRLVFRTTMYPDKEIHILSLTFDSFFMSNICGSSDFARLFPFLLV
jgi:hypothetical protein